MSRQDIDKQEALIYVLEERKKSIHDFFHSSNSDERSISHIFLSIFKVFSPNCGYSEFYLNRV